MNQLETAAARETQASWESAKPVPVLVGFARPGRQNRWAVAFRLILAVPHLLFATLLGIAAAVTTIIGWFAALALGRLPVRLHRFLVETLRYNTRVTAYLFLLTDRYPPFDLAAENYPVSVEVSPTTLSRLAVLFRLILLIPAYVVTLLAIAGAGVASIVLWFIVLISGEMPPSVFDAVASVVRYQARFFGYGTLLTAAYPSGVFGDRAGLGEGQPAEATGLVLSKASKRLVGLFIALGVLHYAYNVGTTVNRYSNASTVTSRQAGHLRSRLVPPPSGYRHGSGSRAITPGAFDQDFGTPGAAESFQLLAGYEQSYESVTDPGGIAVLLFRFGSSDSAVAFAGAAPKTGLVTELDHTEGSVPGIPGSLLVESTKAGNDGFYVHQILAQKDNVMMAIQYLTTGAGVLPTSVVDFAVRQYQAL